MRSNLASILSTVYCFSNLFFLGVAQKTVDTVRLVPALLPLLPLSSFFSCHRPFPVLWRNLMITNDAARRSLLMGDSDHKWGLDNTPPNPTT
jgi:hypothetical protein